MPDLKSMKRKAESLGSNDIDTKKSSKDNSKQANPVHRDRLFLSRLPLTATRSKLQEAFGGNMIEEHHWLRDKQTGAFYGSCIVKFHTSEAAAKAMMPTLKVDKKKVKLAYCQSREGDSWPPEPLMNKEYPPIGR